MLSKIETNPYIRKSISCQSLIRETKLFHSCMIGPQDKVSVKLQPRPSTGKLSKKIVACTQFIYFLQNEDFS